MVTACQAAPLCRAWWALVLTFNRWSSCVGGFVGVVWGTRQLQSAGQCSSVLLQFSTYSLADCLLVCCPQTITEW